MSEEILKITIPPEYARKRFDAVLADLFPDYSRSRLQSWIKKGRVLLDGKQARGKDKVQGDELIELHVEDEPLNDYCEAQPMELDIIYEDDELLVINKPVGLVVHPAAGHNNDTLQNALLYHDKGLEAVPRAGIVHRLDKDTSGLLVVAKTIKSHKVLVDQLQARTVHREYQAVVNGVMTAGGMVEAAIGRHSRDRKKMAVREEGGKEAISHYRVLDRYRGHSRIKVNLETGRTHQIRVHMAHIHYPLVGDATYGGRLKLPKGASDELKEVLRNFKRQALHAGKLGLNHPATGEHIEWSCKPPQDFLQLVKILEADVATFDDDA